MSRSSICAVFVCAAALPAAVCGDAFVEGISNAGVLWHGHFTDRSSLDIFPVFMLAVLAGIILLAASARQLARESGNSSRSLVLTSARALDGTAVAGLLPAIFMVQMLVLFAMETSEQLVVYRHAFGGTLWLGGPVLASLIVHALLAAFCGFGLAAVVRSLAAALLRIVKRVIAFTLGAAGAPSRFRVRRSLAFAPRRLQLATARGYRGPPSSLVLR